MESLAPSLIRKFDCVQNFLFKVDIFTLEGKHRKAVKCEKVHSVCLVDYVGFGYFHQFQKLFCLNLTRYELVCCATIVAAVAPPATAIFHQPQHTISSFRAIVFSLIHKEIKNL